MTDDSKDSDLPDASLPADTKPGSPSLLRSILRSTVGLGLFAVVTAGIIAVTQVNTKDKIIEQARQAQAKALYQIVPPETHDNDLLADTIQLDAAELGLEGSAKAFIARQDGEPSALILPVRAPEGYTGAIELILGLDLSGRILGIRVTNHKETPGLGDKIDISKSDWILGFDGRSLANTPNEQWQVKKDGGRFDQLTGATITPRAIVRAVHDALLYYQANQDAILKRIQDHQATNAETETQYLNDKAG